MVLEAIRARLKTAIARHSSTDGRHLETEEELALFEQQRWSIEINAENRTEPPSDEVLPYGYSFTVWTFDMVARGFWIGLG